MPLSRLGHVIKLWPILSYVFWFVISLFSVPEGDDLSVSRFRAFGPLRYARITLDPASGRSRGTGFVCFWNRQTRIKWSNRATSCAQKRWVATMFVS
jgi:hypothetical protein